jgi:hypothetical protein
MWLENAKKLGYEIFRENDTVYLVNGRRTNIKYSEIHSGKAWFSVGNNYLESIDIFVFLCASHELFYTIPRDEMNRLAKLTTIESTFGLPEFHIDPESNRYMPGSNGSSQPLGNFLNNMNIFSNVPVRSQTSSNPNDNSMVDAIPESAEEVNLQNAVFDWLTKIASSSAGFFRVYREKTLLGDSSNKHRIDIVLEVSVLEPSDMQVIQSKMVELSKLDKEMAEGEKNLMALTNTSSRGEMLQRIFDYPDGLKLLGESIKRLNSYAKLFETLYESGKKRTLAIFEIKNPGMGTNEPAATTYHTHMLRAYARLRFSKSEENYEICCRSI